MDQTNGQTAFLIATDATGFYASGPDEQRHLFHIRWNRPRTARYAVEVLPPAPTATRPDVVVRTSYRGQGPLHALTAADRLSAPAVLRLLAEHGPYDTCMWCHRPLDEPLTRCFGMGQHCATKHLHVTRRVLEVLFRHTPPTGPGVPTVAPPVVAPSAPRRGHLRLVAVNGELVAA